MENKHIECPSCENIVFITLDDARCTYCGWTDGDRNRTKRLEEESNEDSIGYWD